MENKEQTQTNWTPQNGEQVWMKVFSNWSLGTYVGFDTVKNVHLSREPEKVGGYLLASEQILPYNAMPNDVKRAKSAVEWFFDTLVEQRYFKKLPIAEYHEAKAMEREQTMKAQDFSFREGWGGEQCPTNYYDITYGKE